VIEIRIDFLGKIYIFLACNSNEKYMIKLMLFIIYYS